MPNNRRRHKRSSVRRASEIPRARKTAHSVKDLLARSAPLLSRIADQADTQGHWRAWLEARLPADLAARLSGVVERDGTLTLFAESPAWGTRLRYAAHDLEPQIRATAPEISEIRVRVLPRPQP